jgi:hypothetical protein
VDTSRPGDARAETHRSPSPHPDQPPRAVARRRTLPAQALRRRHGQGVGGHLPRRPRDPARRRPLQGARRSPLARGADACRRRAHPRRPLGGRVHGLHAGALAVLDRGVERRVRDLARRAGAQDRRRTARPRRRALRGRGAAAVRGGRRQGGRRPRDDRGGGRRARRRRAARDGAPRRRAQPRAPGRRRARGPAARRDVPGQAASGRASAPGTSCSRAPGAG